MLSTRRVRLAIAGAIVALAVVAPARAAVKQADLANACFTLHSAAGATLAAGPFYLKPTGIGTYLLSDQDGQLLSEQGSAVGRAPDAGPAGEWAVKLGSGRSFSIRSTADKRFLSVDAASGQLTLSSASTPFTFQPAS